MHADELVRVRGAPEARRGVAVLALRDARAVGAVGRVAGHALVAAASADLGYTVGAFPIAERIHRECLSLPIGPHLTEVQAGDVIDAVRSFDR